MRLFIAEKPELGRAIAEALGGGSPKKGHIVCGDDVVTWCFGHMLALCDPEEYDMKYKQWRFDDLPMAFIPWKKKPLEQSEEQLAVIKGLLDRADTVVNAGDPDPEGQLLVDEILEFYRCKKSVKRVLINDNNTELVKRAIKSMSDNAVFRGMSKAAEARQVADQLYGYNMTRAYTLAMQTNRKLTDDAPAISGVKVLSVGRVQTPILGLVVCREAENRNHQKAHYYTVTAAFDFGGDRIDARLDVPEDAPTDEKGRITDEGYAAGITNAVTGKPATIRQIETKPKEAPPPLPFNLLKLQALAASRWRMQPDKVKAITQKLREEHRLITYNRSDCQYLSDEQHADAQAVIAAIGKNIGGDNALVAAANPEIKSRAFDSSKVSAHHAIIPTIATPDMSKLSKDEAAIYNVIAEYYLMQFLPNYKYDQTKATITCESHTFTHTSNKATDQGWKGVAGQKDAGADKEQTDDAGEAEDAPPANDHRQGESGTCSTAKSDKQETKPRPLYTMSTLLADLAAVAKYVKDPELKKTLLQKDKGKEGEHGGIGTAATRDELIKTLFTRGFIEESTTGKKTVILPTEAGRALYASLPDVARTPDLTAVWHQDFAEIERGAMEQRAFIDKLMQFITGEVGRVKKIPPNSAEGTEFCPKCKAALARRTGKNGAFWGCTNRDECNATYNDVNGKPDFAPKPPAQEEPCPKCGDKTGGKIRRVTGKNGPFWSCTDREKCGATFNDKDGKPDTTPKAKPSKSFTCPKCGSGLIRRKSPKADGHFWGCSGYPKCKQTFNDVDNAPDYSKKDAK